MAVQETGMSLSTAIDALPVCLTMMITGSNFSKTASYFQKKYKVLFFIVWGLDHW